MEPHLIKFPIIAIVLFAASLHGVFLAALLFIKKDKSRPAMPYLSLILLIASLIVFNYALFSSNLIYLVPHWLNVPVPFFYLLPPLLWFFVKIWMKPLTKHHLKDLLHFLPAVAFLILFLPTYSWSEMQKIQSIDWILSQPENTWSDLFFGNLLTLQMFAYGWFIWRFLDRQLKISNEDESSQERVVGLRRFTAWFLSAWALLATVLVVSHAAGLDACLMEQVMAVIFALLLHRLSWDVLAERAIFAPSFLSSVVHRYKSSPLTDQEIESLSIQLIDYLENKKPFLNPSLKAAELADQLGIPAHHLSQIMSQGLQTNFNDLLNHYRVEEVKHRLVDPTQSHYSILAVGFDCGFNSKTSFHRIFKSKTGMTPSKFQQKGLVENL